MEGIVLIPLVFVLGFIFGRKSRHFPLQDMGQASVMRFFLRKEARRHLLDRRTCLRDARRVEIIYNLPPLDESNLDAWIDARKEWP